MVFVTFFTHIHTPPALVGVSHNQQLCPTFPRSTFLSINPTPIPPRFLTKARRWDSNAETFRTKNYDFDGFEDSDNNNDDDDDTNQWLDILEDFIDGVWIFKAFRSFGWMLPAIISSLLFTSGPKAFLMAMAIPLGQSALSLLFQTVSGRPKNKTRRRAKSRSKRKPPSSASSYVDIDEEQEEYVQGETTTGYQTWVAGDADLNDKKTNGSASSFGGWEDLDGKTRSTKDGKRKTSKSKMSRRDKRSETPLFLRLLIAVFPFLGSWTRML